jgi:hypothetical protein
MDQHTKCRIVSVGKRRDGGTRYWCLEHKADATAKYGKQADRCRYAHIPSIAPDEILNLNVSSYEGGVALWGAVPPIYDTTERPIDRGIHVHARRATGGEKEIDNTYRAVRLIGDQKDFPPGGLVLCNLSSFVLNVLSLHGFVMPVEFSSC